MTKRTIGNADLAKLIRGYCWQSRTDHDTQAHRDSEWAIRQMLVLLPGVDEEKAVRLAGAARRRLIDLIHGPVADLPEPFQGLVTRGIDELLDSYLDSEATGGIDRFDGWNRRIHSPGNLPHGRDGDEQSVAS